MDIRRSQITRVKTLHDLSIIFRRGITASTLEKSGEIWNELRSRGTTFCDEIRGCFIYCAKGGAAAEVFMVDGEYDIGRVGWSDCSTCWHWKSDF